MLNASGDNIVAQKATVTMRNGREFKYERLTTLRVSVERDLMFLCVTGFFGREDFMGDYTVTEVIDRHIKGDIKSLVVEF